MLQPDHQPLNRVFVQFEDAFCSPAFLDDVVRGRFSFNGESYQLPHPMDWLANPSIDLEWLILLHKFYFAPGLIAQWLEQPNSEYLETFERLILSWIEQVPNDHIAIDVTARRVQNWAYAWHLLEQADRAQHLSCGFVERMHASVHAQLQELRRQLAPARNHRTLELYAVLVASLAFRALPEASDWSHWALAEMTENMRTDLRADGVHCEQSTDYHHLVLRSYLLTVRLARANGLSYAKDIEAGLQRALDFSMHVHRPDGNIPALSDADSRSFTELLVWGAELFDRPDYAFVASEGRRGRVPAVTNRHFSEGGYTVFRSPWTGADQRTEAFAHARYLVLDTGPIGAGNHGHMDLLSFEVAAYGQPLVVDPGRYTYHESSSPEVDGMDWRHAFRSSRAHNTVTVDDLDQGRYYRKRPTAKHKIHAPHPHAQVVASALTTEPAWLHAMVVSPNYAPVHHRVVWFVRGRYWVVLDRLINAQASEHAYRLRYQLSPELRDPIDLRSTVSSSALTSSMLDLHVFCAYPAEATLESGWVSTNYGCKQPAPRLCVAQRARSAAFLSILLPNSHRSISSAALESAGSDGHQWRCVVDVDGKKDAWEWVSQQNALSLSAPDSVQHWIIGTELQHA